MEFKLWFGLKLYSVVRRRQKDGAQQEGGAGEAAASEKKVFGLELTIGGEPDGASVSCSAKLRHQWEADGFEESLTRGDSSAFHTFIMDDDEEAFWIAVRRAVVILTSQSSVLLRCLGSSYAEAAFLFGVALEMGRVESPVEAGPKLASLVGGNVDSETKGGEEAMLQVLRNVHHSWLARAGGCSTYLWFEALFPFEEDGYNVRRANGINYELAQQQQRLVKVGDGEHNLSIEQDPACTHDNDLGVSVWDSGVALANYVSQLRHRSEISERSVLDLGCGTGLVGIACVKAEASKVVLTDLPHIVELAARNVEQNTTGDATQRDRVILAPYDWNSKGQNPIDEHGPYDIVICADCLYDPTVYDSLFELLKDVMCRDSHSPTLYLGYQVRHPEREGEFLYKLENELALELQLLGQSAIQPSTLRGKGTHIIRVRRQGEPVFVTCAKQKVETKDYDKFEFWEAQYSAGAAPDTEGGVDWYNVDFTSFLKPIFDDSIGQLRNERLLEVGCGDVPLGFSLAADGYENVECTDYSPTLIENLRQAEHAPALNFVCMDARKLDYDDGAFSAVVEKATLDTLDVYEGGGGATTQALSEIHRVLAIGGVFISISCRNVERRRESLQALERETGKEFVLVHHAEVTSGCWCLVLVRRV